MQRIKLIKLGTKNKMHRMNPEINNKTRKTKILRILIPEPRTFLISLMKKLKVVQNSYFDMIA